MSQYDPVLEAGLESFPASDPPVWNEAAKRLPPLLIARRGNERGITDLGWLQSRHTFSFGDYHDPAHMGVGPLRVINEDRVHPGQGFATHSHRDMEIISYVLDGTLNHRDSMGIRSDIHAGNVQLLRAGHGVRHSDFNASTTAPLHFLQIWIIPDTTGLEPSQQELTLDWSRIRGRLHLIASPAGTGNTLRIHQDVRLYVGYFDADQTAQLDVADDRLLYVHTARGALQVNGTRFTAGDGLTLQHPTQLRLTDASAAEVLVFDMLGSFHAHRRA